MAYPPRILVAEDEADIRFMTAFTLRYGGFEVVEAVDGVQALELARQVQPDLILLDVIMPKMDGLEACKQLKQQPSLSSIPIIMVTTRGEIHNVETAFENGCADYVTKPINLEELSLLIRRAIEVNQKDRELDNLRRRLDQKFGLETNELLVRTYHESDRVGETELERSQPL